MKLKAKFLPEWIIRNYCHAYMFMQFSIYMDIANKGFDTMCAPKKLQFISVMTMCTIFGGQRLS